MTILRSDISRVPGPLRMMPILLLAATLATSACSKMNSAPDRDYELELLFALMNGTFSSEAQALENSDFLDVTVNMVQIWPERGNWLYVEQALSNRLVSPYRQRVYNVYRNHQGVLVSDVYTLKVEEAFVGKWQDSAFFFAIGLDDLEFRQGCSVFLSRTGPAQFTGGTRAQDCPSELRGARWAKSTVDITPEGMYTWDQGFDESGNQVWGSVDGGYTFLRTQL